MSQRKICDICNAPISSSEEPHFLLMTTSADNPDRMGIDICHTCWTSPVILSEQRRTRTRRKKAAKGRKMREATTKVINKLLEPDKTSNLRQGAKSVNPMDIVMGQSPAEAAHEAAKVRLHKAAVQQGKVIDPEANAEARLGER